MYNVYVCLLVFFFVTLGFRLRNGMGHAEWHIEGKDSAQLKSRRQVQKKKKKKI